jgi:NAD(P)-dependent dehydrogenase (short-subunit alcohol dehydrogenase family)
MDVPRTKRALVIGARGVLGAATVRAFTAAGWSVRSGVRRPGPGQIEVDLDRPDSVAAALSERGLVINTAPHSGLLPERHTLEHGGVLINTSALPAAAGRSLRAVAAGAQGTVLMNAGLAPGVTSLVAADLLRLQPDAEELEIVFTLSSTVHRGPASVEFLQRGLTALAQHRTALVPLPSPFGERACLGFAEGEAAWLGGVAEGRVVRSYVCIAEPDAHRRLLMANRAGTTATLSSSLIVPCEPPLDGIADDEPVAHWVAAVRRGRRLTARTVKCRGAVLHAARSAVIFADALLSQPPSGGCFGPEEILSLSGVETELRNTGITIVSRVERSRER